MRNKGIGILILILTFTSCLKNRNEIGFDYSDAQKKKFFTGVDYSYFDFSRDSLMDFEVFDNFTGGLIGMESWVHLKDSIIYLDTFSKFQITRNYTGDHRQFERLFMYDHLGSLWVHESPYKHILIHVNTAMYHKTDTVFANYRPGSQDRRYRIHARAKRDYYGAELLYSFRCGIDSIPAIGSAAPGQEKREDFYFVQTLGLWEMRESYFHIENGETEYSRLTKTRIH